jgi:F0F1-type ATP synthase assembly protein I
MSAGSPERDQQGKKAEPSPLTELARFSGHGLTLAISTGLFLMAGWWIDGKLGTRPLFSIGGAFLGAGAGLYSMIQHVLLIPRAEAARREQDARSQEDGS